MSTDHTPPGPSPAGQPGPYGAQGPYGAPQPGASAPYGAPPPAAPAPYGAPPPGAPAPYGVPQGATGFGRAMRSRNVFAVWLGLPIITLGIYHLVWWYKINKELSQYDSRIEVNPALSVLAVFPGCFIYVPMFITAYNTGKRVAQAQRAAGMAPTCSPAISCVLVLLLSAHALYLQSEINKINDHYGNPPEGTQIPHVA
ncbi:DUF4234 domain-containing protein [Streptomyces avicenniae]|uniref:DUF4234 domain-containing protein n=1 Tax=Streptomyces avicenniae TaxID=500153 RepID=UPI00069C74BC|nr:DUF4234 domain-containing protein [Streptomyces avicenniae]